MERGDTFIRSNRNAAFFSFVVIVFLLLSFFPLSSEANWEGYEKKVSSFGDYQIPYYFRAGTDNSHFLVLIHGYDGSAENFAPISSLIPENWNVIAMDVLGFGDSTKIPERLWTNIPFHVKAMKDFLDSIGIKHAVFVGNSMGGCIILGLSTRFPKIVDALVFSDPAIFIPRYCNGSTEELEIVPQDVPVLILRGENDKLVKSSMTQKLHKKIINSTLESLPNCGHVPERLCPQIYYDALKPFLSKISEAFPEKETSHNLDKSLGQKKNKADVPEK